eukprot:c2678_g1_i1.p1 GENE.c2678_g1_i1~~c2678_g1_i1.p1  ORF type:complete len:318 (+),score=52.59 c2678_g1_i1:32-985(+)
MLNWRLVLVLFVGIALRLSLVGIGLTPVFMNRLEVSTPVTSLPLVIEGAVRTMSLQTGTNGSTFYDPYRGGDALHQPPLVMLPFLVLSKFMESHHVVDIARELNKIVLSWTTALVFASLDAIIAILLFQIISIRQAKTPDTLSPRTPLLVAAFYLINPLSVVSCVGLSLSVIHSFWMALTLINLVRGNALSSGGCLAVCSYLSPHSLLLLPFAILMLVEHEGQMATVGRVKQAVAACSGFLLVLLFVLHLSVLVSQSTSFLREVFLFAIQVKDNVPGLNIYWYTNLLMFDEFEGCFVFLFQFQMLAFAPGFIASSLR